MIKLANEIALFGKKFLNSPKRDFFLSRVYTRQLNDKQILFDSRVLNAIIPFFAHTYVCCNIKH